MNKVGENFRKKIEEILMQGSEQYHNRKQITTVTQDDIRRKLAQINGVSIGEVEHELFEQKLLERPEFLKSIQTTQVTEIQTIFDSDALQAARKQLDDTGIFLMGETHGVLENPDIYYTLMRKLQCRALALEWEEELSPTIEHFLQTDKLLIDEILGNSSDGRITPGHFSLLKRLQKENMLEKLILYDPMLFLSTADSNKGAEIRDEGMAKNILSSLKPSVPTLITAGSFHTLTNETGEDGSFAANISLGVHLKRKFPNLQSGRIEYLSGSYSNYGIHSFEEIKSDQSTATFSQDQKGVFIFKLPHAHPAIFPKMKAVK